MSFRLWANSAALLALPYGSLVAQVYAEESAVKTCMVDLQVPGDPTVSHMTVGIFEREGKLLAAVHQRTEGAIEIHLQEVWYTEGAIRENLSAEADLKGMNLPEKLVAHAMLWAEDPDLSQFLDISFPLADVRYGKVYQIGEATNMGLAAILEAYDQEGGLLGSFLGGVLIGQCRDIR